MPGRPSVADRARRLLALLPHLRTRGRVPLADLASLVGTDPATVAEDLATLSLCGTDQADAGALVAVMVDGADAIVFGDLPALDAPVRLTAAEARALLAAVDACGTEPDGPLMPALSKVAGATVDLDEVARTVRVASLPGGIAHTHALLTAAAACRRVVRMSYSSEGRSDAGLRSVHPYGLFMSRGHWYLLAFDEDRGAERTFRLDRVGELEATGLVFDRPGDVALPSDAAPDREGLPEATILFAHDAPDLQERDWPGATFERLPDGRVRASVPYAGTAWIARKVAARLGGAVVEAPANVRRAVVEVAAQELRGLV